MLSLTQQCRSGFMSARLSAVTAQLGGRCAISRWLTSGRPCGAAPPGASGLFFPPARPHPLLVPPLPPPLGPLTHPRRTHRHYAVPVIPSRLYDLSLVSKGEAPKSQISKHQHAGKQKRQTLNESFDPVLNFTPSPPPPLHFPPSPPLKYDGKNMHNFMAKTL